MKRFFLLLAMILAITITYANTENLFVIDTDQPTAIDIEEQVLAIDIYAINDQRAVSAHDGVITGQDLSNNANHYNDNVGAITVKTFLGGDGVPIVGYNVNMIATDNVFDIHAYQLASNHVTLTAENQQQREKAPVVDLPEEMDSKDMTTMAGYFQTSERTSVAVRDVQTTSQVGI